MDTRKLQMMGKSTLVVSLPHDWVARLGLKKGDQVTFLTDDDGSLRLFPGLASDRRKILKSTVDSTLCKARNLLTRIIAGNYILGREVIQVQISGQDKMKTEHLKEVQDISSRLLGAAIVEQTLDHITIQNLLDPSGLPVGNLLRRLSLIAFSMQEVAVQVFATGMPEPAEDITRLEGEADKIYWLIVRQLFLSAQDKSIAVKLGIENPAQIPQFRVVAKSLEEMADASERISREATAFVKKKLDLDDEVREKLLDFNKRIERLCQNAVKAFFGREIMLANDAIEEGEALKEVERDLTNTIHRVYRDVEIAIFLRESKVNLWRIAEHCMTIAEIALNKILLDSNEYSRLEEIPETKHFGKESSKLVE
jgi:phosphate uptake regulator